MFGWARLSGREPRDQRDEKDSLAAKERKDHTARRSRNQSSVGRCCRAALICGCFPGKSSRKNKTFTESGTEGEAATSNQTTRGRTCNREIREKLTGIQPQRTHRSQRKNGAISYLCVLCGKRIFLKLADSGLLHCMVGKAATKYPTPNTRFSEIRAEGQRARRSSVRRTP